MMSPSLYSLAMSRNHGPEFLSLLEKRKGLQWEQRAPVKMGAMTVAHSLTSVLLVPGNAEARLISGVGLVLQYHSPETSFKGIWTHYERSLVPVYPAFNRFTIGDHLDETVQLFDSNENPVEHNLSVEESGIFIYNVFSKMLNGGIAKFISTQNTPVYSA